MQQINTLIYHSISLDTVYIYISLFGGHSFHETTRVIISADAGLAILLQVVQLKSYKQEEKEECDVLIMKFVLQTQDSSLIKERLLKQKLMSQILTTQQLMFFVIVSWWTQFLFSGSREPNISISRNILSQLKMPFLFWKRWPEWPHLTQDALSSAVLAEDATISEEGALAQLIGTLKGKNDWPIPVGCITIT